MCLAAASSLDPALLNFKSLLEKGVGDYKLKHRWERKETRLGHCFHLFVRVAAMEWGKREERREVDAVDSTFSRAYGTTEFDPPQEKKSYHMPSATCDYFFVA